mmetsp:Transcript_60447/g.72660  ORF Transcript_60447/g.72660 Transcript_60447/m.72660 type:complete len:1234 (+) Transcript_60447:480-4181(+)
MDGGMPPYSGGQQSGQMNPNWVEQQHPTAQNWSRYYQTGQQQSNDQQQQKERWHCDFCKQTFDSFEQTQAHEAECRERRIPKDGFVDDGRNQWQQQDQRQTLHDQQQQQLPDQRQQLPDQRQQIPDQMNQQQRWGNVTEQSWIGGNEAGNVGRYSGIYPTSDENRNVQVPNARSGSGNPMNDENRHNAVASSRSVSGNEEIGSNNRSLLDLTNESDRQHLSDHDCAICQSICLDVTNSNVDSGPFACKKVILRCRYCTDCQSEGRQTMDVVQPNCIENLPMTLRIMSQRHFEEGNCPQIPPQIRNFFMQNSSKIRYDEDIDPLKQYCDVIQRSLGLVNINSSKSGITFATNNTAAFTSSEAAAAAAMVRSFPPESNSELLNSGRENPPTTPPSVDRRKWDNPQQDAWSNRIQNMPQDATNHRDHGRSQQRDQRNTQEHDPYGNNSQSSCYINSNSPPQQGTIMNTMEGKAPAFVPDGMGNWICPNCSHLPFQSRPPCSLSSHPDPPSPSFVEQHFALCRQQLRAMQQQQVVPQRPSVRAPQYSGYGGSPPNQSTWQKRVTSNHPSSHSSSQPPPYSQVPQHHNTFGHPQHGNHAHGGPYSHAQPGNQFAPTGYYPYPHGSHPHQHPPVYPYMPHHQGMPYGGGMPHQPHMRGGRGRGRGIIPNNRMSSDGSSNPVVIPNCLKDADDDDNCLVLEDDRNLLTDYFFYLNKQLKLCRFTEKDRKTRGGKRESVPVNFGGLQCRHCAVSPNDENSGGARKTTGGSAAGGRKFFWSSVDRLANSFAEIPGHILKCRRCPNEIKAALTELKLRHPEQMSKLSRGSQKVFFRRMWRRLHGDDKVEKVPETSTEAAGSGSTQHSKEVIQVAQMKVENNDGNTTVKPSMGDVTAKQEFSGSIDANCLDKRQNDTLVDVSGFNMKGNLLPSSIVPPRVLLAIEEDEEWLSDLDCLVRRNMEVFQATQQDVDAAMRLVLQAEKRNNPVTLGQVGIRCVHCAAATHEALRDCDMKHLSTELFVADFKSKVDSAALSFPESISAIYETTREFQRSHLESCPNLPNSEMQRLKEPKTSASLSSVLRRFHVIAANALGMVDTKEGGIRCSDNKIPFSSNVNFDIPPIILSSGGSVGQKRALSPTHEKNFQEENAALGMIDQKDKIPSSSNASFDIPPVILSSGGRVVHKQFQEENTEGGNLLKIRAEDKICPGSGSDCISASNEPNESSKRRKLNEYSCDVPNSIHL